MHYAVMFDINVYLGYSSRLIYYDEKILGNSGVVQHTRKIHVSRSKCVQSCASYIMN